MDRDLLAGYLGQGMSLPQIGALTNRDPSTVGYWVQKHGLVANGRAKYAPRGGLTRETLEPLVEQGATLQQMAAELGRSISTVRHWLEKHGLKTVGHRRNREVFLAADARRLKRVDADCRHHGLTEFVRRTDADGWRCVRCRSEAVIEWRRRTKRRLVEEAGGRCILCGYERYVGALQFHHLDPSQKRFVISRKGVTRAFAEVRDEASKCALLCSNCHAEVEGGVVSLPATVSPP
jgi:hypothetical protein